MAPAPTAATRPEYIVTGAFRDGEVEQLRERMRECDRVNWADMHGGDPVDAVVQAVDTSPHKWVGRIRLGDESTLIAAWGVMPHPHDPEVGIPWLAATDALDERPTVLLSYVRRYWRVIKGLYPEIQNYVLAENEKSIRLLEHLGFTLEPHAPHGANGRLYRRFHWRRATNGH